MKKKKEKEEFRLYIDYHETRYGGERESEDRWCNRSDEEVEVEFLGIYRSIKDKFFYDSVEVTEEVYNSPEVYLVVVRYDTGDTFGRTNDAWTKVGIFLKGEAFSVAESIEDKSYSGYKPWEGYFERYRNTEVHRFEVQDENPIGKSSNIRFYNH